MAHNLPRLIRSINSSHSSKKNNMLKRQWFFPSIKRHYSSALYISGKIANKTFSFLTPYLDFDKRFEEIEKLKHNLTSRHCNMDVNELKKTWEFFKSIKAEKTVLEKKAADISSQVKPLYNKKDKNPVEQQELDKLLMQLNIVKNDIKALRSTIWEMDTSVIEEMLKLPTELDDRTPLQSPVTLKERGNFVNLPENVRKSHIDVGSDLGLLEYKDPMLCFLCDDAAIFELAVLRYAGKLFSDDNMIRVAGTDFSRSMVVEASGLDHANPFDAFLLNNHCEVERGSPNRMHLVGGASLMSFLALHTKQLINPSQFPLKYFATGRQYTPLPEGSVPSGLFTLCQASTAQVFVAVKDTNDDYITQFDSLLNTVCKLYDDICDHYRVVIKPAADLRSWEGMRVSFELWSQFSQQYIEVGHISVSGTYFSKRLLIAYQTPTGRDFPAVISGTVLSVPRLLGCLLEQNPERFVIPPKIAERMSVEYVGA